MCMLVCVRFEHVQNAAMHELRVKSWVCSWCMVIDACEDVAQTVLLYCCCQLLLTAWAAHSGEMWLCVLTTSVFSSYTHNIIWSLTCIISHWNPHKALHTQYCNHIIHCSVLWPIKTGNCEMTVPCIYTATAQLHTQQQPHVASAEVSATLSCDLRRVHCYIN